MGEIFGNVKKAWKDNSIGLQDPAGEMHVVPLDRSEEQEQWTIPQTCFRKLSGDASSLKKGASVHTEHMLKRLSMMKGKAALGLWVRQP
jgi:hypothetical protein